MYFISINTLKLCSLKHSNFYQGKTTSKLGPFHYPEPQTAYTLKQHVKSLSGSTFAKSTDRAYCLPTGSIFVSERVLRGVLPSVLDEILATRAMLKKAAKQYKRLLAKPPKAVLRQLEARQLALKYVANVTCMYLLYVPCFCLYICITMHSLTIPLQRRVYFCDLFRPLCDAFISRLDCRMR